MRTRPLKSSSDPVPPAASADASASQGPQHRPVLLHEAIQGLEIRPDDVVVDATLGGGGHARVIAGLLGKEGTLVGIDMDQDAIERTRTALKDFSKPKIHLVHGNFRDLENILGKCGIPTITKALFDLGWSGYQLAAGRGFSFSADEPLLMTYADTPGADALTARKIVNEWEEESIADIIFGWGEERYSRRIARSIVERRAKKPFETSRELAELIKEAVPPKYRHGPIHPATRTFQALRIAVNDELGALKKGLTAAWNHLSAGGRIAVVTFHSIEDRQVKRLFVRSEKGREGRRTARKPIVPGGLELKENPRARSAKLRVIEKMP